MKQTLKVILLWAMRAIGLFALGRYLTRRDLMIVGWHGVSMDDEHERFPNLFITPDSLRQRLTFLKKHYRVVSLQEAVKQHGSGRFSSRQVVLTFDDGFYNFLKMAVPILHDFAVTATNYIDTDQTEDQRPTAPLLVRDVILSAHCLEATVSLGRAPMKVGLRTPEDRVNLTQSALAYMESLPVSGLTRIEFAKTLASELGVLPDSLLHRRVWHKLNVGELQQLSNEGFSIQLHTHRHRNVVNYYESAQEEIETNRAHVERFTGTEARDFCYPSGRWSRRVWPILQNAGIRSAVTTRQGPNSTRTPIFALRRVMNGESSGQLEFEFQMSNLRWLQHAIRKPSGRHCPSEQANSSKQDRNWL